MLYQIFYPLRESFFGFNLFRYITFRTAGAVATALILVLLFAPNIIEKLRKLNFPNSENITIYWHDIFETKENLTKKANAIFDTFGEETFLKISQCDPKIFLYLTNRNFSKNFYKVIKRNSKNFYIKTLKNEMPISTANRAHDTYKKVLRKIKEINKDEEKTLIKSK